MTSVLLHGVNIEIRYESSRFKTKHIHPFNFFFIKLKNCKRKLQYYMIDSEAVSLTIVTNCQITYSTKNELTIMRNFSVSGPLSWRRKGVKSYFLLNVTT